MCPRSWGGVGIASLTAWRLVRVGFYLSMMWLKRSKQIDNLLEAITCSRYRGVACMIVGVCYGPSQRDCSTRFHFRVQSSLTSFVPQPNTDIHRIEGRFNRKSCRDSCSSTPLSMSIWVIDVERDWRSHRWTRRRNWNDVVLKAAGIWWPSEPHMKGKANYYRELGGNLKDRMRAWHTTRLIVQAQATITRFRLNNSELSSFHSVRVFIRIPVPGPARYVFDLCDFDIRESSAVERERNTKQLS